MGHLLSCAGIRLGTRITEPVSIEIPIHHKCRNCGQHCDQSKSSDACIYAKFTRTGTKEQPTIIRTVVPNDKVLWSTSFDYHPIEFTSEKIRTSTKEYVDRDPRQDSNVEIPWNSDDRLCDRRSYHGPYKIVGRVPQNPCGRTGITGRGYLGHFGPNHAADPIVTRWKRDRNGRKIFHPNTKKGILEFVCILRRDTGEYAIPGGMVDKKEKITDTLQREFHEEVLNFPDMDESSKEKLIKTIKHIFENGGTRIYCGYVDDPRNTDNCWMETTAYNFHDEDNENLALINVQAGDDATHAFWHDLDPELPLFASHADFLRRVAYLHKAH
ncbi:unnamed protein product, partial [Rotaria sp. Silwood2]